MKTGENAVACKGPKSPALFWRYPGAPFGASAGAVAGVLAVLLALLLALALAGPWHRAAGRLASKRASQWPSDARSPGGAIHRSPGGVFGRQRGGYAATVPTDRAAPAAAGRRRLPAGRGTPGAGACYPRAWPRAGASGMPWSIRAVLLLAVRRCRSPSAAAPSHRRDTGGVLPPPGAGASVTPSPLPSGTAWNCIDEPAYERTRRCLMTR